MLMYAYSEGDIMYKYDMYKTLKEQIEKLEELSFDFQYERIDWKDIHTIPLLRSFLVLNSNILNLNNEEQQAELVRMIDNIIIEKFKELKPDFSDSHLKTILKIFKMAYPVYPIDIYVVLNAVFLKKARLNDFSVPENLDMALFNIYEPYHPIYNLTYFSSSNFDLNDNTIDLNSDEIESITERIKNYIIDTLSLYYDNDFIVHVFHLGPDEESYGKNRIFHEYANVKNVFLDRGYSDILKAIIERHECDIEMIVENEEDFAHFCIHQVFIENELVWNIEKVDTPVWCLSEAVLEKNKKESQKKLLVQ